MTINSRTKWHKVELKKQNDTQQNNEYQNDIQKENARKIEIKQHNTQHSYI